MTLDYAARNPLPLDVISIQSQVVYGTVGMARSRTAVLSVTTQF